MEALAELLRSLDPDEVEVAVGFLTGAARQGRIGVGWRSAYRQDVEPAAEPSVEILEVDRILTELAGTAGPGHRPPARRCSPTSSPAPPSPRSTSSAGCSPASSARARWPG